jgi:predicted dehydrogenase
MPEVDAVYIAEPNDRHAEFPVRCAREGVHVLCEKPLAISEEECRRMIDACRDAGVKLMTAYRLHFEPSNLEVVRLIEEGRIGEPRVFTSTFAYQVKPGNIRTSAERGGGAIWDLGIYCINAARYLFRADPTELFAMRADRPGDPAIGWRSSWSAAASSARGSSSPPISSRPSCRPSRAQCSTTPLSSPTARRACATCASSSLRSSRRARTAR